MTHYSLEEPIEAQPADQPRFGRYRLAYQLASGGMGTVYLARAEGPAGFEKLVALKRIHPHLATDRRFVSMFLDEARIAGQIQHPNVCGVIDFGEVDGSFFLTMPFILGEPLNRVIGTAARLPPGPLVDLLPLVAARLVADACEGLHAAHELRDEEGNLREVVHRDVSPHNLMVGYDGIVRVLDFGVASARDRHHQTSTGEVKGKFAYLAPEQIEGRKVDRRADIWSLGVVLWEAVTARRLFARDNMAATINAVTTAPIPSLRTFRPDAPEALDTVVQKALARDPAARYQTARAMGRDLAQILAREDRFVGPPEVAEWMLELFPDGLRRQERLVEGTRTGKLAAGLSAGEERSAVQRRERAVPSDSNAEELPIELEDELELKDEPSGGGEMLDAEASHSSLLSSAPEMATARAAKASSTATLGVVGGVLLAAIGLGAGLVWWTTQSQPEMVAVELTPSSPIASPTSAEPSVEAAPSAPPTPAERLEERAGEPAASIDEPTLADETAGAEPEPESASPPPERTAPTRTRASDAPARAAQRGPRNAARERPRGEGTVTVATPGGWALVFLGNRQLGEAPGVFTLPAGAHTLFIQPFGRGDRIRRRVVVREGSTARLTVSLSTD